MRRNMDVTTTVDITQSHRVIRYISFTSPLFHQVLKFAVKFQGDKKVVGYILAHQPKSFNWRQRNAKLHPWKQAPDNVFKEACVLLDQILTLAS